MGCRKAGDGGAGRRVMGVLAGGRWECWQAGDGVLGGSDRVQEGG